MSDYDKAGRYLIKRDPAHFFLWLLGRAVVFHLWIDARRVALPDQGDLTSDLVAAFRVGREFEALCVELQAESESATAARIVHGYIGRLRSEPATPESLPLAHVGGVVINLTGPAQPVAVEEAPRIAPDCRLTGTVLQRTLRDRDAAATADEITAGQASRWLLAWLPLMQGGGEADIIERWKREAARLPTERDRQALAGLTLTFSELARRDAVWNRALEGWTVIKSPFLEELREKVRIEAHAEGRTVGRLEEARSVLLRQGRKKFGRPPTKKQQAELNAITDLTR